ncbi:MAG: hypothetical protein DWC10_08035 [Candidatus Poseidoniales archaeon]|nr:hypothetical protein [Euryarchaeota archaeon]RJU95506.1 MAG: hypothetical protein DWC10_08035 [Candidatus Poseidoniales archaeon]
MRDLLASPLFASVSDAFASNIERFREAPSLHLSAPASLAGVLALGQLEAACLDLSIKYSRRFFPAKHHLPRDEQVEHAFPDNGLSVVLDVEEDTWDLKDMKEQSFVHVVPLKVHIEMGSKHRRQAGALGPVIQAAALAAALSPNGRRVRKLRPFMSLGLWMRGALDTSFDPIHTAVVQHLKEEGSVRIVPLPEVAEPTSGMIPGLAERQLHRLAKAWPTMDVDARTLALSELVLPSLVNPSLSTPRLEELMWHRMLIGEQPKDVVSQAHAVVEAWPEGADASRLYASKVLDAWLVSGELKPV